MLIFPKSGATLRKTLKLHSYIAKIQQFITSKKIYSSFDVSNTRLLS